MSKAQGSNTSEKHDKARIRRAKKHIEALHRKLKQPGRGGHEHTGKAINRKERATW
jgi:hypothetical protein